MSTYVDIPDSGVAGLASTTSPLTGDGSGGSPITLSAASAATAGSLSIIDFNKLATVPTGHSLCVYIGSAAIDLTAAPADYVVIAPMAFRCCAILQQWEIRSTGGVVSTSPTFSLGTNATFDNLAALQTKAGFTTQVAATVVLVTAPSPAVYADLTTLGLKVRISIAATGVAPVLTAKLWFAGILVPV